MKALLLNGSIHGEGCTYTALSAVAEYLEKDGVETELFHIGKEPIRGCAACGACKQKRGRCIFGDDTVNGFLEKMENADALVVGSPVYFASANGALIAFLDRAFYASDCFAYKPAAAVASARRAGTTATVDELNKYFMIKHMPIVTAQYWNMVHGNTPEEVKQDLEGMQNMRTLGRNMAWLLKSIAAGRNAGLNPPEIETKITMNFIR